MTMHKCKKCKRQFKGSGKAGRPFDNCPQCRKSKGKK